MENRSGSKVKMTKLLRTDSNLNVKEGSSGAAGAPKLKLKIRPPSTSKHDVIPPAKGATPTDFRRKR